MSTTKLDAEVLARKAHPDWGVYGLNGYSASIREVAQPLADELAQVKAERDELREALGWYEDQAAALVRNHGKDDAIIAIMHALFIDGGKRASAILEKYPKPLAYKYCYCQKPPWDGPDVNGECVHCGKKQG